MNNAEQVHWSEAFGRSTFGNATWTDRTIIGNLRGAPAGRWSAMYSGSRTWKLYADGGWDYYDNYTLSDANQRGARVYGWATLRFLCAVNEITPPSRRLKGEPFVPSTEILVRAVWEQLANQRHLIDPTSEPHVHNDTSHGARHASELRFDLAKEFWRYLERLHDDPPEGA